jgi:hypothetical protein
MSVLCMVFDPSIWSSDFSRHGGESQLWSLWQASEVVHSVEYKRCSTRSTINLNKATNDLVSIQLSRTWAGTRWRAKARSPS